MTVATLKRPVIRHASEPSALDVLSHRTKRLDGYSYKLAGGNQYGLDVAFADEIDIDEKRMSIWIPYADGNRRDGVGDLLEVGGIILDRHRKNPIHLFDHGKAVSLPIGKVEDPDTGEYTSVIDVMTKTARDNVFFYQGKGIDGIDRKDEYDHAVFCEQIYHMLCKRFLRAGSIGYQAVRAMQLPADYESGVPQGLHLLQTLKLESSSVVLPASGDTVRKMLAMPTVCGKRLSPYLVKSLTPYAPLKTAQLGYEWRGSKALPDIRKKYRPIKGVRRRVKRSASGSSVIHVRNKDLDAVRQAAESKGIKFENTGGNGATQRVRLSGDDGAIDGIAKQYGQRVKSMATKGYLDTLPRLDLKVGDRVMIHGSARTGEITKVYGEGQHTRVTVKCDNGDTFDGWWYDLERGKTAAIQGKNMQTQTKSIEDGTAQKPDDGGVHAEPDGDEAEGGEDLEPYGAQVLRRIHEDHSILMEEYDEMMQVLEQEDVKDHLQDILENLETVLSDTEDKFAKAYKDLPGIEGADEKDMDGAETNPTEATSEEEDVPTEDEAVEGMRKKYIKALRGVYRRKSRTLGVEGSAHEPGKEAFRQEGNSKPVISPGSRDKLDTVAAMSKSRVLGVEGSHEPGKEAYRQEGQDGSPVVKPASREKLDTVAAESKSRQLGIEDGHEPGKEGFRQEGQDGSPVINPRHRDTLDTVVGFVKDLSQTQDLTDQHRFDAYHYHKLLDPIGDELTAQFKSQYPEVDVEDSNVNVTEPTGQRTVRGDASGMAKGFGEMEGEDSNVNVTVGKGWHVAVKGAAGWLRQVATTNAGSGSHMQKAAEYAKMLDGVIQQGFPQVEAEDGNVGVQAPAGDVSVKALKTAFLGQSEAVRVLQQKLDAIKIL